MKDLERAKQTVKRRQKTDDEKIKVSTVSNFLMDKSSDSSGINYHIRTGVCGSGAWAPHSVPTDTDFSAFLLLTAENREHF